jgi:Uma2 family endonuclease
MAPVLSPPAQCVILHNVPWTTYQSLSPFAAHEELKDTITLFVNTVAEEMAINTRGFGSTTFQREDLQRGFEPDGCFYIQSVALIAGKTALDLTEDPPPDLVIEIDLSHPSLPKFPIFAQLGIPEVWRWDRTGFHIFRLMRGQYVERPTSTALPGVPATSITEFLDESRTLDRLSWLRRVRAWVRTLPPIA